jgi:Zn-dependent peptidase ImmA (M78 family)
VDKVAKEVVLDQHITALPVCPFAIAQDRGIVVQPKPMKETGCSGMLIRLRNEFGILYATHLQNEGFERFSIAHELGHYFLPDHPEHVLRHGAHQSYAGFGSRDAYEREADFFASSLLMPPGLFRAAAARYSEGLDAITSLADVCKVSLTASAISYAKHGHAAVAVILSTGGVIDCCFQSDAMKSARVGWLRPGRPVPRDTLTRQIGDDRERLAAAECLKGDIQLQDWFGEAPPASATEEVVGLGRYGKVLTIIHCSRLTARAEEIEIDGDDETSLIESWTPLFPS